MAINRAPWNALVDDDGSNLVGSIWNKAAIKTVLLDPIDAQISAGTWTPVDGSGAALTFTVNGATYWKFDKLVVIAAQLIFPTTASVAPATVAGLPFVNGPTVGGLVAIWLPARSSYYLAPGAAGFTFYNATTGVQQQNQHLSAASVWVGGSYLTA